MSTSQSGRDSGTSPTAAFAAQEEPTDAWTLMVKGEIDVATAPELRRQLEELADSDPSTLTLDMSGVTFIDSSGLGALVGFLQHLREQNRDEVFVLAGLPGPVRKVFDITGLGDHFRVR